MIFDLKNITDAFGNITGIIHVGAFRGEEIKQYREIGLKNTILFEPQEHLYYMFKYQLLPTEQAYNFALGDEEGELDLYISKTEGGIQNGSGASSSFLKPKIHLTEHPNVIFDGTIEKCKIKRLDNVVLENNINISEYNLLSIDVQGYELKVLKGSINTLNSIKYIIAEVNRDEVYEGCPMVNDIDNFLNHFGFKNVYTYWQSKSWGDALYVKQ